MESAYTYLLIISIILMATKLLGVLSQKVQMPQVVGALVAGLLLGPSVLGVIEETDFLVKAAEIGVILLMFQAGLETDLDELKSNGKASFIVAIIGVIVPLIGGAAAYYLFFGKTMADDPLLLLKAVFVGVTLTATSVSITVETLREMGKLQGAMGTTILGAAVIDDIAGIIVLTVITGMKDAEISVAKVLLGIIEFFLFVILVAAVIIVIKKIVIHHAEKKRRTAIYALTFCLMMSYVAEQYFGVADITGAYFAGVILCNFGIKEYIDQKVSILSYMFFSPIFFASIGIKTSLSGITSQLLVFAVILMIIAILTKIVGCGLGAKLCKFNNKDALAIGIGMVSRGEVALIVAQKGAQVGLLDETMFPAIVVVVIVTTLLTPVLLRVLLGGKKPETGSKHYKPNTP